MVIPFTCGCGKKLEAHIDKSDALASGEDFFAVCLDCGARTPMPAQPTKVIAPET